VTDATLIRAGQVHTATDRGTVEGDLLLVDGVVRAVGEIDVDEQLPADASATEIDATGWHVTPGLVDAHSHAGMAEWGEPEDDDVNEGTSATTPHVTALDGFNPRDEELRRAVAGGVTTVSARMGSGNVVGGVICSMKTHGRLADEMLLREDGMKAAMGENPKRFHGEREGREPSTRPGVAATLRSTLMAAEDYLDRREHARANDEPFERDLGNENLARVLRGDLALRVHAHRADDIATVFRIADEFGIDDLSIEHATEGLPVDAAVDVVTRNPAEILGIADRVGSLEPGTDADVVVWDGPFHRVETRTRHVFVGGEHVFDRSEDEDPAGGDPVPL